MAGNRWTFLLIRDSDAPVGQYRVRERTVRVAAVAGIGLGVVVCLTILLSVLRSGSWVRAELLERENALLSSQLSAMRDQLQGLESNVKTLSEDNAEYRILAGLDPIDEEVLAVGVGGPGSPTPEAHPLWGADSSLSKVAFAVQYDLNALERRSRLLEESFAEATDTLRLHDQLLESTPSILPTSGVLTSGFSRARPHPIHHQDRPHQGIDVSAREGTPILAAAKGKVIRAKRVPGYGQMVEVDHGFGYVTRYGHASKILVRVGQEVHRGEVIALVGHTGTATSSHLHYEVWKDGKPVNPIYYVLDGFIP